MRLATQYGIIQACGKLLLHVSAWPPLACFVSARPKFTNHAQCYQDATAGNRF